MSNNTGKGAEAFLKARDYLLSVREDQPTASRDFRWPQLETFNWALDYFDAMAHANDDPALWIVNQGEGEIKLSFSELSQRSSRVANFLREQGVKRGDRILLMLGNEPAIWDVMLAAFKLGAVVIPASVLLTPADLADRIERGGVAQVVAGADQADKFGAVGGDYTRFLVGAEKPGWVAFDQAYVASADFTPDGDTLATDPLLLYFTSGTTSKPKLVMHTHQSYPLGHLSTMYWVGLRPGDRHLNISSPGWAKHAWSSFFAPWNAAACIFVYNAQPFSAKGLLDMLANYGITSLCAPPTVWRLLIQEDMAAYRGDLKLREVVGAGEPLNPEIIARIRHAWGITLRDGYGQTETTAQVGNAPGQRLKPGSMGRPLPGFQVALLDADEREGDIGEVCLKLGDARPAGLMAGYADSAEKTQQVTRGGYYHTGDVAERDSEGYLTFIGRADDVFKSSDYRISPFELESVLIEHEAVAEVAVIPSPDAVKLAVPKAFVTLVKERQMDAQLARELLAFARHKLAAYKRVRRLEFVSDLPKTISGKIRRVELRGQEVRRRDAGERVELEFFEEDFPDLKSPD